MFAVFNSVDTLLSFKVDILRKVEVEVILMGVSYKIVVVTVVDELEIVKFTKALDLSDVKMDVLSGKLKVDAFPSVDKIVVVDVNQRVDAFPSVFRCVVFSIDLAVVILVVSVETMGDELVKIF